MVGITPLKICEALIYVTVPLETLPAKGKISNIIDNNNNNENDNDSKGNNCNDNNER